ncbi:MAG: helix-turn-helix domain-containing protein [Schwartzia sp.]|nr:helix-turn-helix domain-containing protein [Schwartzia sp. (in: firmicutes)]
MMGSELKAERERQGYSIQDIERETSIRAVYLEALEQNNYNALPNEVYVKGFIRNYAAFLHLDAERLVQEYREAIHGANVGPIVKANPETTSLVNESAPFSSGSDFHERVEKSAKKQMIFMAVATVVIAFVGSIYYFFGDDPNAVQPAQTAPQTVAQQPQTPAVQNSVPGQNPQAQNAVPASQNAQPAAQQQQAPVQTIGNTANASAGQADVSAKLTDRCWMQVIADGKTVYEGTAEANQTMRWTAKDSIILIAGNAGAVDATYNGQRVGILGKKGDVVEKKFSKGKVEDVK